MVRAEHAFWPYSRRAAVVATVVSALALTLIVATLWRYSPLAEDVSLSTLLYLAVGLSFVPMILAFLDEMARRQGVVDLRWLKLDFSKREVQRESVKLPDNLGVPGALFGDTSAMTILSTLQAPAESDIVQIDIGSGHSWWATRLLVVSARAVRVGVPKVFVFVGVRENQPQTFLGWTTPRATLDALLDDNPD